MSGRSSRNRSTVIEGRRTTKAGGTSAGRNADDEFVMTLDSDDDVPANSDDEQFNNDEDDDEDDKGAGDAAINDAEKQANGSKLKASLASREKVMGTANVKRGKAAQHVQQKNGTANGAADLALNKDFMFDLGDGYNDGIHAGQNGWDMSVKGGRQMSGTEITVDDIIERKRKARPGLTTFKDEASEDEENGDNESLGFTGFDDDDDDDDDGDGNNGQLLSSDEKDDESDADSLAFGAGIKHGGMASGSEDDDDEEEEDDPLESIADSDADENGDDDEASRDGESSDDNDDDAASASDAFESDEETEVQKAKKAAYFAAEPAESSNGAANTAKSDKQTTFQSLSLSRPIMRALSTLNFHTPTPIQAKSIPIALAGKDIVAGAVTGSGKTAAFLIPILERLAHRPKGRDEAKTRVLILMPTRELAVQCISVGRALAKFMDIGFCLCVGGLSLKVQEAQLKERPDIVVATPGRLIDHVRNSASFGIDDVEIMVMDEADRMLEEGFQAELDEIIKATPKSRQTMLFSATMTDDVDELVRLSMKRPVKLFVDPRRSTAQKLVQEFVRVRGATGAGDDDDGEQSLARSSKRTQEETRMALLLSLCLRTFKHQVIIFVRSKKLAHQLRIIFGLLGLSAGELHGDLSQEQRLQSLQAFRDGKVDILLATDLASRGLDIKGVQTVINYDMPAQLDMYLHRVGRTARAGRNGRSVTLVGEADRKMLKTVLKRSPASQIRHRLVPSELVADVAQRLTQLKADVEEVLKEEKEEKLLRQAEMQVTKGENLIKHHDEIMGRPKRTWFVDASEKASHKNLAKLEYEAKMESAKSKGKGATTGKGKDKYAGLSRKKKRAKMAREEMDAEDNNQSSINASIRAAKRSARPKELGAHEAGPKSAKRKQNVSKKPKIAKRASGTNTKDKKRSSAQKTGKNAGGGKVSASGFKRDKADGRRNGGGGGGKKAKTGRR